MLKSKYVNAAQRNHMSSLRATLQISTNKDTGFILKYLEQQKNVGRLWEGLEKMLQNRGTIISRPTQPSGLDQRLYTIQYSWLRLQCGQIFSRFIPMRAARHNMQSDGIGNSWWHYNCRYLIGIVLCNHQLFRDFKLINNNLNKLWSIISQIKQIPINTNSNYATLNSHRHTIQIYFWVMDTYN